MNIVVVAGSWCYVIRFPVNDRFIRQIIVSFGSHKCNDVWLLQLIGVGSIVCCSWCITRYGWFTWIDWIRFYVP